MKKLLALLMVLVLCISICACGGETEETSTTKPESVTLEIGETTKTDVVEFALTRFEFADKLKNATFTTGESPDPEYLLPTDIDQINNPFEAQDSNVMISFSYTLKNIGKEELNFSTNLGIVVNYNDGYKFDADVDVIKGEFVILNDTTSLDPLTDPCEGRGYIEVPSAVAENEDTPLSLTISLPLDSNSQKTTEVTYKVR